MNRRANIFDSTYLLTEFFLLAILLLVAIVLINQFDNAIQGLTGFSEAKTLMGNFATAAPQIFDLLFLTLFVGVPLVSAILAYFNNIPPVFFWLSIGTAVFNVLLGKGLEIAWNGLVIDSTFAAIAPSLPMTSLILGNYGFYSYFIFVIVALGTFVRVGVGRDAVGGL